MAQSTAEMIGKRDRAVTVQISDDFDLEKIAESGQCFRWEQTDSDTWRIIAGKSCLRVTDLRGGHFEMDCTQEGYDSFWHDYFDLDENYRNVRERIDPGEDPFLWQAAEFEKGIRILRQDPWEMLITFIISQNRNIPAIKRSVELLALSCGDLRHDSGGMPYYAFPEPEAVLALSGDELTECRLGYRCRYVHEAARAVLDGDIDLKGLLTADEDTTIKALTALLGVGVKVANCVSLFGLHHINAFPIDVWVKRILEDQYPDGYPYDRYAPYNGIYQQYMYAYYRHKQQA